FQLTNLGGVLGGVAQDVQGVEEGAHAGLALDLGEVHVVVRQQGGLLLVHAREQVEQAFVRARVDAHGDGVEEQADDRGDIGDRRGRPETVLPKTMSSRPVCARRVRAQAVYRSVLGVTPMRRATVVSAWAVPGSSVASSERGMTGRRPWSGGATRVGASSPPSASRQAPAARSMSWRDSQTK